MDKKDLKVWRQSKISIQTYINYFEHHFETSNLDSLVFEQIIEANSSTNPLSMSLIKDICYN